MSWGNYGEFATFHFLFHVAETNLWSLIMSADQNTLCCLLPCAGSLHTPYWAYPWASGRVANTNHWHGTALGAGRTGRQRERGFKCRSLPVKLPVNMLYDKWPFWFHRVQENRFEGTSKKPRERKHKQRLPRATQILSLKCSGTSRKNLNSRPAPDGPCPPRPASPARTVRSRAPAGPQPPGRRAMPSPLPRQRWEAVARPRGPARPSPARRPCPHGGSRRPRTSVTSRRSATPPTPGWAASPLGTGRSAPGEGCFPPRRLVALPGPGRRHDRKGRRRAGDRGGLTRPGRLPPGTRCRAAAFTPPQSRPRLLRASRGAGGPRGGSAAFPPLSGEGGAALLWGPLGCERPQRASLAWEGCQRFGCTRVKR